MTTHPREARLTPLTPQECLAYYAARLERVEAALGRTWAIHMGLVALGLYGLWYGWQTLPEAGRDLLGLTLMPQPVSLVLGCLLLYGFVRLGFLISQFLEARRECDALFQRLHPEDVPTKGARRPDVFTCTNFFEPLYRDAGLGLLGRPVEALVILVGGAVVGIGNALTLVLTTWARGSPALGWPSIVLGIVSLTCYALAFFRSPGRMNPALRSVVIIALCCAVSLTMCALSSPPLLGIRTPRWASGAGPATSSDLTARAKQALADIRVAVGQSLELRSASEEASTAGAGADSKRLLGEAEQALARGRDSWAAIEREIGTRALRHEVLSWLCRALGEEEAGLEDLIAEGLRLR
jgi:hypothetical protein